MSSCDTVWHRPQGARGWLDGRSADLAGAVLRSRTHHASTLEVVGAPGRVEYIAALDAALLALRGAQFSRSSVDAWSKTLDVLAWLYRLEEMERRSDKGYFAHRGASAKGRTLGGVIWARGLVDHHQAQVHNAGLMKMSVFIVTDADELQPMDVFVVDRDRELQRAQVHTSTMTWAPRCDLPPGRDEKHGRDAYYDEHVAGRPVLGPLVDSREYLVDERSNL